MVFCIYQVCHNIENQIPKLYGDERLSVQKVKAISLNFFQLRVFQWQCIYLRPFLGSCRKTGMFKYYQNDPPSQLYRVLRSNPHWGEKKVKFFAISLWPTLLFLTPIDWICMCCLELINFKIGVYGVIGLSIRLIFHLAAHEVVSSLISSVFH